MMFAFEKFILLKMHKKSGNNANALAEMPFWNHFFSLKVSYICEVPWNPCTEK